MKNGILSIKCSENYDKGKCLIKVIVIGRKILHHWIYCYQFQRFFEEKR